MNNKLIESLNNINIDNLFDLSEETIMSLNIQKPNKISKEKINEAKKFNESNDINIVYPCDNIDALIEAYKYLNNNDKFLSDSKCLEIFGVDNIELYNTCKNEITITESSSDYDIGRKLIQLDQEQALSNIEEAEIRYNKRKLLNMIKNNAYNKRIKWEFSYAPYFTPMEIEELNEYYSEDIDEKCNEIFKEYVNYFNGYTNNFDIIEWKNTLEQLQLKLEYTDDYNKKDYYKQCMVSIGWNPEIPFNENTQLKAKNRMESILNGIYKNVSVLDLSSQLTQYDGSDYVQEANKEKLYPISIVLVKGNSLFSDAISKVTKGEFSHSAICIDNSFDRLYSFNMDNKLNKNGGFSLESIRNYPKENRVSIFTFFVKEEYHTKISNVIQTLLYDIKQTTYSMVNILLMPFNNINLNMPESMICSQFVDKMLKLANVDITNIDSSKVTPNYLYNVSIKNSKIYKLFDGALKDFDDIKATKFIDRMSRKAKPINESTNVLYEYCISQYLYPVISEARQLPIQFNKDGDALLTNPFIDFDSEYSASHKLLLQYEKSDNIEGMKYELARLYYMNYILEKKLYSNKLLQNKDKNIKTRARILNDFNKYLKYILSKDKEFNFAEYYEHSPFYAHTIQVKSSTIKQFKNIIKDIL